MALRECAPVAGGNDCSAPEICWKYWKKNVASNPAFNPDVECFVALLLNSRCKAKGHYVISTGLVDSLLVHPRETFRAAIVGAASRIVLMHNHPSGDPTPSETDIRATRDMVEAGKLLKIEVADHVIMGAKNYFSFREHRVVWLGEKGAAENPAPAGSPAEAGAAGAATAGAATPGKWPMSKKEQFLAFALVGIMAQDLACKNNDAPLIMRMAAQIPEEQIPDDVTAAAHAFLDFCNGAREKPDDWMIGPGSAGRLNNEAAAAGMKIAGDCEVIGQAVKMIQEWVGIARRKAAAAGETAPFLCIIEGALHCALEQAAVGRTWRPGAA